MEQLRMDMEATLPDRHERERRVCSFTGHRTVPRTHLAQIDDLLSRAVAYAYERECRTFCCGGAVGFDTMAARAVIRFRLLHPDVRLLLLLPCREQDAAWSPRDREAYAFTLSGADEVIYISDVYTANCIRERNQALAERCDILVAYLLRDHSGAAQTVRMARRLGKEIFNLAVALPPESAI